jgi:uncharacterized protein with GYD domain
MLRVIDSQTNILGIIDMVARGCGIHTRDADRWEIARRRGNMLFVDTMRWAVDKTPEVAKRAAEQASKPSPKGVKVTTYLLLGRCQMVSIIEAPNEKAILQLHLPWMDIGECDWAPAMKGEDLLKALS